MITYNNINIVSMISYIKLLKLNYILAILNYCLDYKIIKFISAPRCKVLSTAVYQVNAQPWKSTVKKKMELLPHKALTVHFF